MPLSQPTSKLSQSQRMWEHEVLVARDLLAAHLGNPPGSTNDSYEAVTKQHAAKTRELRRNLTRATLSLEIIELTATIEKAEDVIAATTADKVLFTKILATARKKLAALR